MTESDRNESIEKINILLLTLCFPDHQTEDRQQPVRQRLQRLIAAHRHGEVQGILGPALCICCQIFPFPPSLCFSSSLIHIPSLHLPVLSSLSLFLPSLQFLSVFLVFSLLLKSLVCLKPSFLLSFCYSFLFSAPAVDFLLFLSCYL